MKAAKHRQKSYIDNRMRLLKFQLGDKVFLKVAPWKKFICCGMKGKLSLRYIRPFEVVERIGLVAYKLTLLPYLSKTRYFSCVLAI